MTKDQTVRHHNKGSPEPISGLTGSRVYPLLSQFFLSLSIQLQFPQNSTVMPFNLSLLTASVLEIIASLWRENSSRDLKTELCMSLRTV